MNLLQQVPGFRSSNKNNKIIASVYYLFLLANMVIISIGDNPELVVLTLPGVILPFVIFGIIDIKKNIENKEVGKKVILPIALMMLCTFIAYYQH
ncbi:MAG: hypothetical protein ACRC92_08820 [Peptostreptococcaceae bacterium]